MTRLSRLADLGTSVWLDGLVPPDELRRLVAEDAVTGLTSNPTIFDKAIGGGTAYDEQIAELHGQGLEGEELFFELAITDLRRAAELFRLVHERTTIDGRVSLEVSPLIADDATATIKQAAELYGRAEENFFIKIPGTGAGLEAIEESIFAGIPINVTLLFSTDQYLLAADAYMRGLERRVEAGLNPDVASVASLFISRWDAAVSDEVPDELRNKLGIAVGKRTYAAYRELLDSDRAMRLRNEGAKAQRLLWASTGTKDPGASDVLYIEGLTSPFTVNTMPEKTLQAFADHGEVGEPLPVDGGDAMETLRAFNDAGIDTDALAVRLQEEGKDAFSKSWADMLDTVAKQEQAAA
jgi:transaldolase